MTSCVYPGVKYYEQRINIKSNESKGIFVFLFENLKNDGQGLNLHFKWVKDAQVSNYASGIPLPVL